MALFKLYGYGKELGIQITGYGKLQFQTPYSTP